MRRHPFAMSLVLRLAIVVIVSTYRPAYAVCGKGACGQPLSGGPKPTATDCVFILHAAVGLVPCDCICDVDSSDDGTPNSTDALKCLDAAVGLPIDLVCPCIIDSFPRRDTCSAFEIITAAGSSLDAGWSGAGHDAAVVEGASIFVEAIRRCGDGGACFVDADCAVGFCELTCDCDCDGGDNECEITGPVGDKHCLVAMNQTCEGAGDCPSGQPCEKFFGPPLPLVAEGTPTCVTTYFQEDISGTLDTGTGATEASASLRSRVHLGIQTAKPCPRCGALSESPEVGDTFSCDGGPRNTKPCTVDAVSPDFGGTSYDCPPNPTTNVSGVGLAIKFRSISTGTRNLDARIACGGSLAALHPSNGGAVCLDTRAACQTNADCMRCTGAPTAACSDNGDCTGNGACVAAPEQPISCGVYCHCGFCDGDPDAPCSSDAECDVGEICEQGAGVTQQLQGNKCSDLVCGLGGEEQCCSSDTPSCANPTARLGKCSTAQYLGCDNNADCSMQAAGTCVLANRPCFENRISRTGEPSPLGSYCIDDPDVGACQSNADCGVGACVDNTFEPTAVALFCIPPTASGAINAAGGIPGPGAVTFKSVVLAYRCGNHVRQGIEECDDGDNENGDGCDELCRSEPPRRRHAP